MSTKADVHTHYPQDLVADTALGYTWHGRWQSSQKSISGNGCYQSRQATLPVSQILALHNVTIHRLIFHMLGCVCVCVRVFMQRINGVLISLFK